MYNNALKCKFIVQWFSNPDRFNARELPPGGINHATVISNSYNKFDYGIIWS